MMVAKSERVHGEVLKMQGLLLLEALPNLNSIKAEFEKEKDFEKRKAIIRQQLGRAFRRLENAGKFPSKTHLDFIVSIREDREGELDVESFPLPNRILL